jgi:holo-[acyl-carrier protein] synthase
VDRFSQVIERGGDHLLNRLFTKAELRYAQKRKTMAQHLAARFAAKEAVVKALGVPKGLGLEWHDLEIVHAPSGRPQVVFHRAMSRLSSLEIHLSLTHTKDSAIATAFALTR